MAGIKTEDGEELPSVVPSVRLDATKRPLGDIDVKQEDAASLPTPSKRPRKPVPAAPPSSVSIGETKKESDTSSAEECIGVQVDLLQSLPLDMAVEATAAITSGLSIELMKTKVEVCWEVADDEAEDPTPITLW